MSASDHWYRRWYLGRLQLGFHAYRHRGVLPDRWVIQPFVTFDRKRHRTEEPPR